MNMFRLCDIHQKINVTVDWANNEEAKGKANRHLLGERWCGAPPCGQLRKDSYVCLDQSAQMQHQVMSGLLTLPWYLDQWEGSASCSTTTVLLKPYQPNDVIGLVTHLCCHFMSGIKLDPLHPFEQAILTTFLIWSCNLALRFADLILPRNQKTI